MLQIGLEQLVTFCVIVSFIVVSPGPNLFLLLNATPTGGRPAGMAMTLGISTAIVTHAVLAMIGVGAVIATSALLFSLMKAAGAAYLIWLGIKALMSISTPLPARPGPGAQVDDAAGHAAARSLPRYYFRGFLTNFLNPKPAIFYLAIFPQFLIGSGASFFVSGLTLALVHASIAIAFYGLAVFAIDAANIWLRKPLVWKVVRSMSGLVLISLGVRLLLVRQPVSIG